MAVVSDPQLQHVLAVPQQHLGAGARAAVLAGVGQRLLHDAVGGQGQPAGQRCGHPLHGERDRQPGGPGLLQQLAELADARQRDHAGTAVIAAQHAEHAAHLGQRLPPGAGDVAQRLPGPFRRAVQGVGRPVGLHDHHADVVRDHVVQFAGDPGPLGRRGDLRLRVPFPFQPGGPVLQRGVVGAAVAHRVAEHPGDQHRPGERYRPHHDPVQHAEPPRGPECDGHRRADQADAQPGNGDPAWTVSGQGVEQDDDGQVGRAGPDVQHHLERAGRDADQEGPGRVSPAEGHRRAHHQHERDELIPVRGEGLDQAEERERGGEHAVHQPGVAAQPDVEGGHWTRVRAGAAAGVILEAGLASSLRRTVDRPGPAGPAGPAFRPPVRPVSLPCPRASPSGTSPWPRPGLSPPPA